MSISLPQEKVVFDAALEVTDPAQRRQFLDQACDGDTVLRSALEELLQGQADAEQFFAESASSLTPLASEIEGAAALAEAQGRSAYKEKPGTILGRYKLLQKIGEGGWGVVFMAQQDEPVRRKVALKVVKPGMDTRNVIARFEAERQALALMDHPNIAHVLDAGASENGRPYFVMELVRGTKITDYCDQSRMPTADRLELFIQVCHAVQHAHQKGIIHRDIKPSNILVTTSAEGKPLPKVIDFGIAKATSGLRLTEKTLFTAFETLIGTPAYMSPEQAALTSVGVDTRTDIYSLGVLLYELLTGSTPFDTNALLKSGLDEIRFTEAIEWAEKTLKGTIIYPNAQAYAIQAMAHWQLGRKDAARVILAKGDSLTPKIASTHEAVDLGDSWVAWLEARISLDEAGQLITMNSGFSKN